MCEPGYKNHKAIWPECVVIKYEEQDEGTKDVTSKWCCINISSTFKLTELYTIYGYSQFNLLITLEMN